MGLSYRRSSHGGLACVIGKLVQFGQTKMVDIEFINLVGYHQAMYHALECMRLSLFIKKLLAREPLVCACSTFFIDEG